MKLQLIAACFMLHTISSFASQNIPTQGLPTCGAQTLTEIFYLHDLNLKRENKKNKNYPQLSREELNEWIKTKELEIEENKIKAALVSGQYSKTLQTSSYQQPNRAARTKRLECQEYGLLNPRKAKSTRRI